MVLQKNYELKQQRLRHFLSETRDFFFYAKKSVKYENIDTIKRSLHEVFELTLLDYFLAEERVAFASLLLHRECHSDSNTQYKINDVTRLNTQYFNDFDISVFAKFVKQRIQQYPSLASVIQKRQEGETLVKEVKTIDVEKPSQLAQGQPTNSLGDLRQSSEDNRLVVDGRKNIRYADFSTAKGILQSRNIELLSKDQIEKIFEGRGYTLQVVSTTSPNEVEQIFNSYKNNENVHVYLSKVTVKGEEISIFKILVGLHQAEDVSRADYLALLEKAKKSNAFLKPYSFVRSDVAKRS